MTEVVIVGGGPAGSSLALHLARQGLEVELYEQSEFPREKPCGEGLLPPGVEVLRRLGLLSAVGGMPLQGVCHHVEGGAVRAGFSSEASGEPRYGLGQRRCHLDRVLFEAATSAVFAQQGAPVTSVLVAQDRVRGVVLGDGRVRQARWVVAADGARSTVCRCLGLSENVRPTRLGVRAHFQRPPDAPAISDVHVFLHRGYELYVTPLPQGGVTVAALAHEDAVPGSLRVAFEKWCNTEPLVCDWLDGATQTSDLMGRAPLLRHGRAKRLPGGLILLGDADRSVDPITAGGMSLALTSAELLGRTFPAILGGDPLALMRFEIERARAVRRHRMLGAGLRALGSLPQVARAVRMLVQAYPGVMTRLVDFAATEARC